MTSFSLPNLPVPENEPVRPYASGSKDAELLAKTIEELKTKVHDVPLVIAGKQIHTDKKGEQRCPGDHKRVLCRFSMATPELVKAAIDAAVAAKAEWENLSWPTRIAIFLRAADLVSGKYRNLINAATMLGQAKTVQQSEIDAVAEVCDFLRFNVKYAEEIYRFQPSKNSPGCWNREEFRPLEGFVWALSPFNFTAIGANLPTSPAMVGNVVVWKPASSAVYSNWVFYQILVEAGLPPGVINFLPGSGSMMSKIILDSPHFAGLHFTGSTEVFNSINVEAAKNLDKYKLYPRIVGETGGKDFHFVHETADVELVANSTIRGAFEYQGQKCSACSRMYVPDTIWESKLWPFMKKQLDRIKIGMPEDFSNFMSAVIDRASFDKLKCAIEDAKASKDAEIIYGGTFDDSKGYYIHPTIILAKKPKYATMEEELFGPVLTIYVYKASEVDQALTLCDETSPYGLTGAVFARDVYFIEYASRRLRQAAGNFYVNDKCTGSVVGQQPFGGARKSGTNDKAGEKYNLLRWVSVRTIKENLVPLPDFGYPHMGAY